jgi:hypothetical protein
VYGIAGNQCEWTSMTWPSGFKMPFNLHYNKKHVDIVMKSAIWVGRVAHKDKTYKLHVNFETYT